MRRINRYVPVIAPTALAMTGDDARIRAAGCDGYIISQPLAYMDFLAVVSAHSEMPR